MKLVGLMSTAVLSLTLVAAAPVFAQDSHDQQEEQKAKPEEKAQPAAKQQDEKNAQQEDKNTKQEEKNTQQQEKNNQSAEKNAQQEDKNSKQEEKNAQQQQAKPAQQAQRAGGNGGGGIPADRFKANFGREHSFRVSQGDYNNRRFQYGGYTFGFVDQWPSNWLYTQNVYVVEINGVYYLCNASFPGVNLALSFTL
jgi:outer membrane biosynthesis protein TonB